MTSSGLLDLSKIGSGFSDIAIESQSVFRQALAVMSRPGEIQEIRVNPQVPKGLHTAAGALLLALLDQDTSVWLSPSMINIGAGAYLRFHTGCSISTSVSDVDFVLVGDVSELPAFSQLSFGTEEYPERSTTIVLQVDELIGEAGWKLSGPGIDCQKNLRIGGLGNQFIDDWKSCYSRFPLGIDIFFANDERLAAISRTTRIEE